MKVNKKLKLPAKNMVIAPYAEFLKGYFRLCKFELFMLEQYAAEFEEAHEKLMGVSENAGKGNADRQLVYLKRMLTKRLSSGLYSWKDLQSIYKTVHGISICNHVNNFLTYLSHLFALIYVIKPDALKSNEQISVKEALSYARKDDLIKELADRRVHQLSYKGIQALDKYTKENIGLKLILSKDDMAIAIYLIEVRNLLTHNRGIVNRVFLQRVGHEFGKKGEHVSIGILDGFSYPYFFVSLASSIESRARKKFNLPAKIKYSTINRTEQLKRFKRVRKMGEYSDEYKKRIANRPTQS
ncbi:MAG: hypothetical protein AABZ64_06720 [Nitrospinota bacterium]